ncbi:ankyrin repeat domain-containing protein [Pedobacter sp. KR3-3]|uniref:Ankyrin repeat domain-containing protein n=1 Tax=Pedobacter albus TaxID=3113905 RepID=A0ABU7I6G2_9SPHI|nr:ankyrin repeat domain-containing protein [Pedobacter sp. KR3-3]MEE1944947.1 ankyrin repeat domain-containing protein [Pedobacter sp. KR3-3]
MLQEQLQSANYSEALAALANGEKLPNTLQDFQKQQLVDQLLRDRQFDILLCLVKDNTLEKDIYEYSSFNRSIFESMVRYLPDDEASIAFLEEFCSQLDNLNDEVEAKTLLGYFFENMASVAKIKVLLAVGADTHFKNNAEENFIHQVVKTYSTNPALSLAYLELLIAEGLDLNAPNIVQKTPLIAAIEFNRPQYIDLLLENGADVNQLDKDGNNAFYYAVAQQFNLELYHKLRNYGTPQFDILNKNGVSLLFEYIRMLNHPSTKETELLAELIADGADLYQNSVYYGSETSPADLLAEKSTELLQTVLDSGSLQVNRQDENGNTLLHKVCAFNVNYETEKAKDTYRKAKLLLEHGADATLTNNKDQTALMLATDDNLKIKTVELLMKLTI